MRRLRLAKLSVCLGLLMFGVTPTHAADALSRPLTAQDLLGKSPSELSLMRNQIYAHHGYIFQRKDLDAYFRTQPWYHPVTHDVDAVLATMTRTERNNISFLTRTRRQLLDSLAAKPVAEAAPPKTPPAPKRQTSKSPTRQQTRDRDLVDAVRRGDPAKVKTLLLQGADPNTQDEYVLGPDRATPLILAARLGNPAVAELLLKAGADATAADPTGMTPLTEAAIFDRPALATLLMDWGAKDTKGEALREAVTNGYADVAEPLLARGAPVKKADLLQAVAAHGFHAETAPLLLAHGADVNAQDKDGVSALMYAAAYNDPDAVEFLLAHGADLKARDKAGWSPLHHAALAHIGDDDDFGSCRPATARILLAHGASVAAKDNKGNTPLHRLAEANSIVSDTGTATDDEDDVLAFARLLFAHGAKPDVRDQYGKTPLMVAAAFQTPDKKVYSKPRLGNLLLMQGADVNLRDNKGNTALMWAAQATGSEKLATLLAQTLIAHGISVTARNDEGATASQIARDNKMPALAALLGNPRRQTSDHSH